MTRWPRLASTLLLGALWSAALAAQGTSLEVERLRVVSAAGTPVDNCDGLRDTLNGISNVPPTFHYVVRLEPGLYDCGAQPLFLAARVTLEGAGTWSTEIFGEVKSDLAALLNLNHDTEVRKLRIRNFISDGPPNSLRVVAIQLIGAGNVASVEDVYALAGSEVGGPSAAVRVDSGGRLVVRSSTLFGSAGALTAEGGRIEISYSNLLPANMVSGFFVTCLFSTSFTSLLTSACTEIP